MDSVIFFVLNFILLLFLRLLIFLFNELLLVLFLIFREVGSKIGSDLLDEGISDRGSDSEIEFKIKKIILFKSDFLIYYSC